MASNVDGCYYVKEAAHVFEIFVLGLREGNHHLPYDILVTGSGSSVMVCK